MDLALLAAAAAPLPVDALWYAKATFWATILVGVIALLGYLLARDWTPKLPKLVFIFNDTPGSDFQTRAVPGLTPAGLAFDISVTAHNVGRARASKVRFQFSIPSEYPMLRGGPGTVSVRANPPMKTFITEVPAVAVPAPEIVFVGTFVTKNYDPIQYNYAAYYKDIDRVEGGPQSGKGTITLTV